MTNPFESPQSQPKKVRKEPEKKAPLARPVYRWLAAAMGILMGYSSLRNIATAWDTPYFGSFVRGAISGLMGMGYFLWIAVYGTLPFLKRKGKDE